MKLIEAIMTNNPCYKQGRTITVKGLMLHSVGCSQPSAKVFVNNWNKASYDRACVHGFIDGNTGEIYQTLPWNYRGWHAGGAANNTHIGVEMCEPATITYTGGASFKDNNPTATKAVVMRTYQAAVELFAMLCEKFNLDPLKDGVIISHSEGYKRGIASNHGDVEHIWKFYGLTMDGFRKAVKAAMTGGSGGGTVTPPTPETPSSGPTAPLYRVRKSWADAKTQKGAFSVLDNAKKCADTNPGYSVFDSAGKVVYPIQAKPVPFKVQITTDDLRIRTQPGTDKPLTGKFTGKGVFTIVEVQAGEGSEAGWGKLKSGAGWIALDYAKIL